VGEVKGSAVLIDKGLAAADEDVEAAGSVVAAEFNLRRVSSAESRPEPEDHQAERELAKSP
jgi:hypothetical protein